MAETNAEANQERGRLQTKTGKVVSNAMDKTVVVSVSNTTMHPLYRRYMKRTKNFHVHDAENTCNVGDEVTIVSCRPLSKRKRWRVSEIVKRAE